MCVSNKRMRASFIYHQITAMFSVISTLLLVGNLIKNLKTINVNDVGMTLALLSVSWGVHAIIHFLEEYFFDFEPLSGSSHVKNNPVRCC